MDQHNQGSMTVTALRLMINHCDHTKVRVHSTAWDELGCGHDYRSTTMQEIGTEEDVGVYYMVDI